MKVKNRKLIRKLSFKSMLAARKKGAICICAIALTSVLFTTLFTMVMSLNATYQNYQFKMVGGYNHGAFKAVSEEQIEKISAHPKVKETGARTIVGIAMEEPFADVTAEVSYMEENNMKWTYSLPTTGRIPQKGNEVAMDTKALELLGVKPQLGAKVTVPYQVMDKEQLGEKRADEFVLVGYWEYDNMMPVHFINVSKEYQKAVEQEAIASGMKPFRTDLNVMMASSYNIEKQMQQVDTDLGYDWESYAKENSVRIGVNWGYTSEQLAASLDAQSVIAVAAFLILIIFTGYLIIYNIFQISVVGDIRYYGLLKTIGVTPRQLRRIIRYQACFLCIGGVPLGLLIGYGIGAVLTPFVLKSTTFEASCMTISTSPVIFLMSAVFSVVTVLISCAKPGRMAGKVSPIEATRYTQVVQTKKKSRSSRGAKVYQMAFANLGRNRKKTVLVVVSLSLAVALLNILMSFVSGFDVEKYLQEATCADFIVSSADYFRCESSESFITDEQMDLVRAHTNASLGGCGYTGYGSVKAWMDKAAWDMDADYYMSPDTKEQMKERMDCKDGKILSNMMIEGFDTELLSKLSVIEGDITPLQENDSKYIALDVDVDEYGRVSSPEYYPEIGEKLTVIYTDSHYIDSRTGEPADADTPWEYATEVIDDAHEKTYTVCAYVDVPYAMGYRYYRMGYAAVLPVEIFKQDSGQRVFPLFYLFDTPDEETEREAENYLAGLTQGNDELKYESKAIKRAEFEEFRNMFLIVGGALCVIIELIGMLNFFNAVMTGILARRKEFAVLEAIGMTKRQLRQMLIYEGLFYAVGSGVIALVLSLAIEPFVISTLQKMFWFYSPNYTVLPVVVSLPLFALLGWLIPTLLNGQLRKHSVVERLRTVD
ncbi:MAG: FtsX-like permease family protein [bacterium]|nr:FtsX-like permease family protein [bacterium]